MGGSFLAEAVVLLCVLMNHVQGKRPVHNAEQPPPPETTNGCDLFHGSWVRDESNPPPYNSSQCPFIEKQFDCEKNGRNDTDFLKYKWQTSLCTLPRFSQNSLTLYTFSLIFDLMRKLNPIFRS